MRVLINDRHCPHAYMVATALSNVRFTASAWNGAFRPIPRNVRVVPFPNCLDYSYDAVIEDDPALPSFQAKARNKIWIQHCEYNLEDYLPPIVEKANRIVVVTDHKRATMREFGFSPKVATIGFGFDIKQWPIAPLTSRAVGTAFNAANNNSEVMAFFEVISSRVPFTIIGYNNDQARGCSFISPYGLEEYQKALAGLSIWINCVEGETLGMSPLEAMATGIPVVMGNYPEAGLFAFNNWNCVINRNAPRSCVPWILDKVQWLVENQEDRLRIGLAGRKTIESVFPVESIAHKWMEVLQG